MAKKKILYIEDEEDLIFVVSEKLKDFGYEVTTFEQGQEGIDFVKYGGTYNLALVDLTLKDISGLEVIRQLKRLNPNLPVWSYSGDNLKPRDSDNHIIKSGGDNLEKEVDEFLKPKTNKPL